MKKDINQLAYHIVKQATDPDYKKKVEKQGKDPKSVEIGCLGGLKGGDARAKKLTAEERKEIAKKAAKTRWSKK